MQTVHESIRVLHVDDDPAYTDMVATFLEREDDRFDIESSGSASDGLDRLASDHFDCIVSDFDMPQKNGIQFLETVREEYGDVPFILFTGKGSEEIASEAISAGVSDYLQKGGTERFELLANRIVNLVDQAESFRLLRRLKQIAEAAGHAIYVTDRDGVIEYVNPAFESITEYTKSDAIGETPRILNSGENPSDYFANLWDALESGKVWDEQIVNRKKSGETYHAHQTISPVLDLSDEIEGFVAVHSDITERMVRERELAETKQRLELAMEDTDSGVWEWNVETEELFWSEELLDSLGYSQADFPNTIAFFDEKLHPDDVEPTEAAITAALEEGESYRVEQRIKTADGEYRWIDVRGQVVEENGTTRMVGVGFDITEQKAREQYFEERVKELDAIRRIVELIEGNDISVPKLLAEVAWSLPDSFHYSDLTEVRVTYGTNETVTDNFHDTTSRIDAETETTNGNTLRVEAGLLPADTISRPEFLQQEQELIKTIVSFLREYIDREEQLTKLHTAEQRYETILTHLSDYVMIIDGNANIDYVSPAVEKIAGYDPTEVVGTSAFDYVFEDDQKRATEAFAKTFNEPKDEVTVEFRSTMADGSLHWIEARGRNYLDEPLLDGLLVAVRDITARKERESALRRERDRLDEFAGVVSHDLRNPLNVAQGRLELAQEECDSEHLDAIETAIRRIDRITEDVLWLARDGQDIGSMDTVVMPDAIDAAWNIVSDREKHAKLHHTDDELSTITIEADEDRLCQLLENLFTNAIEHGGEEVTVTVGAVDDGFYVEDDGPGVPEDRRDDVFTAGYSTGKGGTGFGLNIVKQVVEGHDWEIHLTEGSEGGARFEITGVEIIDA